jgi:group I intron endonuclease
MGVLYRITNNVNKKMYFGQTIRQPEERKNEYFKSGLFPNDHIKNSFNKYGKENFEFHVMFECPEEMLDVCEELLIYLLDTQNREKGYNKDSGGNLNKYRSEESKQNQSKSIKEYWDSEVGQEQKRKLSESRQESKNPNWRRDLDNDEIVDLFVNQGKTEYEIADLLNTNQGTIHSRLVKMGVDTSRDVRRNTTGYYRVSQQKNSNCKQGFIWIYKYYDDGIRKSITSVDLKKLEAKVKGKGLLWKKL